MPGPATGTDRGPFANVDFEQIFGEISTIHQMCTHELHASLPDGMSVPKFMVLRCLTAQKRRITEIADVLSLSQPSVSDIVRRLHAKGWVTIRVAAADRRQKIVGLSAVGRRKYLRAEARYRQRSRKVNMRVEPELMIDVHHHLRRLRTRLDRIFS